MDITASMVKGLRETTGAGIMDCKRALKETEGDLDKAVDFLRKKGLAAAAKKVGRASTEGIIASYIHPGGKIGVMVEINCETDFVAKTDDFQEFAKNITMHIAAAHPLYLTKEDVPKAVQDKEREIYRSQAEDSGKPEKVIDKIVDGKLGKYYSEVCLMEQLYVKDTDITIRELVDRMIAKIGENISIRRFTRYQLSENIENEKP